MTQDQNNLPVVIDVPQTFDDRAKAKLSDGEYKAMSLYISQNKPELALTTCNSFFELFLNGNSVEDIHKMNTAYPIQAIQWARIKYDWDRMKEMYVVNLQSRIADKVMKAQLEVTSFYADVLSATVKKHGNKVKRYLQTGDEKDLGNAMGVDSIGSLARVVEALQKITGQDRNIKVVKEDKLSVGIQASLDVSEGGPKAISEESAAQILHILAEEKRKKEHK